MNKKIILYLFSFISLIGIDQISKLLALKYLHDDYNVLPFFKLTLAFNKGISFGMFGESQYAIFIFALILALISYLVWLSVYKIRNQKNIWAEILIIAGASSNIIDRVIYSHVVDFILVYVGNFSFPVFNLADSFITIGVMLLFFESFYE